MEWENTLHRVLINKRNHLKFKRTAYTITISTGKHVFCPDTDPNPCIFSLIFIIRSTLQSIAKHWSTSHFIMENFIKLQYIAVHKSYFQKLQSIAVYNNSSLQYITVHCGTLRYIAVHFAVHCSTLQYVQCTYQYIVVHFSTFIVHCSKL